jgi:5S rRNA maturation endonuclease (ribonuclease M5)
MGKISPVSIKYIVHASMELSGIAERPDIIGAIFGQTEGLLGSDLELRELQKSGRIGRIDVRLESKAGKTTGEILLPSSMGKTETAIIAAALETIERVGPCDAKIKITNIEDVRISKRTFVLERAKELLTKLVTELPDSQAFTNLLAQNVRTMEVTEYGKDRLPAGPAVDESEEIIIVEGRADVINLLRYGIRNVVALKGARASDTIIELTKKKITTLFVDGDRGGDLIIKNLASLTDLDYVTKAPDGKEVEELTQKEIMKALRLKVTWEQVKGEIKSGEPISMPRVEAETEVEEPAVAVSVVRPQRSFEQSRTEITKAPGELKQMKTMAEELLGTRGAFVLDKNLNVLGRVPVKELEDTLRNMTEGVFAVVMDGIADMNLVKVAEDKDIKYIIAHSSSARSRSTRILTPDML